MTWREYQNIIRHNIQYLFQNYGICTFTLFLKKLFLVDTHVWNRRPGFILNNMECVYRPAHSRNHNKENVFFDTVRTCVPLCRRNQHLIRHALDRLASQTSKLLFSLLKNAHTSDQIFSKAHTFRIRNVNKAILKSQWNYF